MWRDIGLGDWLFDMDNADDVARIVPTVLSLATDPAAAKAKVAKAAEFVRQHQAGTMAVVKASTPLAAYDVRCCHSTQAPMPTSDAMAGARAIV